jgi:glycyl-tRNA synthetase beta chain
LVFGATSLADKIDTLAGYFSLGLEPKGSSDPFGLRRAGQGVVRVLLDFWTAEPRPSLRRLIAAALAAYPDGIAGDRVRSGTALEQFLRDRIEYALEARGVSRDEVWAVMAAPAVDAFDDPRDAEDRGRALHSVRAEAPTDFAALAEAFKRANNILSGQQPAKEIDAKHFERDSERELHAAIQKLQKVEGSYAERLRALASLREPIDRVFAREQDGGVLVMAADPRVRANRLALLDQARALFHRIADISKLQGEAAS